LAKLTAVIETVEGDFSILAHLDEVAVGITHVAAPFPAVIVQWLGKKERSFVAPLFVAGPDVGDTQIKEAIYSVQIRRCFKKDLWLIESAFGNCIRPTSAVCFGPPLSH